MMIPKERKRSDKLKFHVFFVLVAILLVMVYKIRESSSVRTPTEAIDAADGGEMQPAPGDVMHPESSTAAEEQPSLPSSTPSPGRDLEEDGSKMGVYEYFSVFAPTVLITVAMLVILVVGRRIRNRDPPQFPPQYVAVYTSRVTPAPERVAHM